MALLLPLSFHVMSVMVISSWGIVPLLSTDAEIKLPIAAKFPFDVKPLPIFICVYLYQVIGIALSALTNVSWDTISSALMAHVNSQIERLGIQLSLVSIILYILYKLYSLRWCLDCNKYHSIPSWDMRTLFPIKT